MRDFFRRLLCGAGIGLGCIIPGVSGSVIAVAMGLYEKMLTAITGLLKAFKKNFLFLLPIGIGCVFAVLLGSLGLKEILSKFEAGTFSLFVGFVIGSFPVLYEETLTPEHRKPGFLDIVVAVLGCALVIVLELLSPEQVVVVEKTSEVLPPVTAVFAGLVLGLGLIVPGLSSSFLLEFFGLYRPILNALADVLNPQTFLKCLPTLFFAGIGVLIGAAIMVLIMRALIKHFHVKAYFAFMGVSFGTILLIVPKILVMDKFSWICFVICAAGIAFGLWQSLRQIKRERAKALLDSENASENPEENGTA